VVIHQYKCRLVRTGSKAGLIFESPKSKPETGTRTGTERPVPSF